MKELIAIGKIDLQNIFREKILLVIFVVAPVLYLTFAEYGVPWITSFYPSLANYKTVLFFLIAAQLGTSFGLVTANIILDEKDQEVLQAIKVLPLSTGTFLGFRFAVPTIISVAFTLLLIHLPDLIALSNLESIQAAVLFALIAPQTTMLMTIIGGNKVEGLAVFKFLNLVVILPAVSEFLPAGWDFALAFIPSFWIYRWIFDPSSLGFFAVALLIQILFLWYLFIQFRKRVF